LTDAFNLEETVTTNYVDAFALDEDAGGGVPKRRDDSIRNSPDTSIDETKDRKELVKIHRTLNKNKHLSKGKKFDNKYATGEFNMFN